MPPLLLLAAAGAAVAGAAAAAGVEMAEEGDGATGETPTGAPAANGIIGGIPGRHPGGGMMPPGGGGNGDGDPAKACC